MSRLMLVAALMSAVALPVFAEEPWPAPVPGHVAPKAGEHPRLFFRKADLPELRKRAQTPEGKALIARLKAQLGGDGLLEPATHYMESGKAYENKDNMPLGTLTISHVAGYGFLYQLTGDKSYANLGKIAAEKLMGGVRDRDDRYSFKSPGGALRAGPSLGWFAIGYDLCYDGWDEAFRTRVAKAIETYSEGKFMSLEELVRGARHMPASNHWGMQVGGGAIAILAIMNDPGIDQKKIEKLLETSEKAMIRNVTEGFGDHGWYAEGDGTGVMASHIIYVPAIQAWRVAGGKDFASPRPNVKWTVLKFLHRTLAKDGKPQFLKLGAYPHNVWNLDGVSGPGTFGQAFGIMNDDEKAALLWLYNRLDKHLNPAGDTPFETACQYPHRTILSFVNWPYGMKETDPASVIPMAVRDEKFGFYAFRNRFKDASDTLIQIQAHSTRGWHKADSKGEVHVWSQGKTSTFGSMRGPIAHWQPGKDGSGIMTAKDGTSLAVDFSGSAGVEAMLVMTGPQAGKGDATVDLGGRQVTFLFLGGKAPAPTVTGDRITVGRQTITLKDGNLTLATLP